MANRSGFPKRPVFDSILAETHGFDICKKCGEFKMGRHRYAKNCPKCNTQWVSGLTRLDTLFLWSENMRHNGFAHFSPHYTSQLFKQRLIKSNCTAIEFKVYMENLLTEAVHD